MVFFVILFPLINKWEHSDTQNDRDRVFDFVYVVYNFLNTKGVFYVNKKM
jgi:hypothetical protein